MLSLFVCCDFNTSIGQRRLASSKLEPLHQPEACYKEVHSSGAAQMCNNFIEPWHLSVMVPCQFIICQPLTSLGVNRLICIIWIFSNRNQLRTTRQHLNRRALLVKF
ncbi:uncharacterized protein LOC124191588 [Daphnia pulex]|uniref:uncharacterized protein LOC124191588 n=1 Tax=Daphnia pulex TaxID=6669 RepID=UPI001EDD14CA|nr:uncharacterized protein LOC124191588 [Daphnia pulex]XP_046633005.1 uncharacterized protein LOC124312515 [Daphnia pulicaria]XP_046633006.1 uncharacterized protein LOC124312515 [Daphnia pulicaria]